MMRAIDLCCGAGGWACAARGLPIKIELAVDFWEPAAKTYELNHPQTQVLCGDLRDKKLIRKVQKLAKGVDLILGGIPCEWLSVYRALSPVQASEVEGERALLDAALGLVRKINPPWWCLEDVIALTKELPPFIPWQKINSRLYSAQRRKRVYVGWFPEPKHQNCQALLKDHLRRGPFRIGTRAFGRNPVLRRSFTATEALAAHADRKAPTVAAHSSRRDAELVVVDGKLPGGTRQMEWQEMAGLQGFPEDYLFYGSPTDVGKMIGRAVQIDTARAILEGIVRQWQKGGK